jgi:hypothetical protein
MAAAGDTPLTRISERRVGYRLSDLQRWLDGRRFPPPTGERRHHYAKGFQSGRCEFLPGAQGAAIAEPGSAVLDAGGGIQRALRERALSHRQNGKLNMALFFFPGLENVYDVIWDAGPLPIEANGEPPVQVLTHTAGEAIARDPTRYALVVYP